MALISIGAFQKRIKNLGRAMVYRNFQPGGRLHSTLQDGKVNIEHPEVMKFMKEYGYNDGLGHVVRAKKKQDMQALAKKAAEKRHGKKQPDPLVVAAENWLESASVDVDSVDIVSGDEDQENTEESAPAPAAAKKTQPKKITVNGVPRSTAHHTPPDEIDRNIDATEYLDMPMRAAVLRFGDQAAFKDWVNAVYKLAQLKGMEEDQARKRGEVVSRDVAANVVLMVDALNKALLSDVSLNIAVTAMAMAKAGAGKNEIEQSVRGAIERTIKLTKQQIIRRLEGNK